MTSKRVVRTELKRQLLEAGIAGYSNSQFGTGLQWEKKKFAVVITDEKGATKYPEDWAVYEASGNLILNGSDYVTTIIKQLLKERR